MRLLRLTLLAGLFTTSTALLVACGPGDKGKEGADAGAQSPAAAAAEEKVLNVYNWSDYIAEDTIKNFEAESGIKVNYDTYDSNEMLESKLSAGNSGYDIVVPSASFMERQIKAGVYQKLDKSKLTNLSNMDPDIMKAAALHDPGNEHSVDYMWGTTGIGYNEEKVTRALGKDAPVNSWALVFDPKYAAKLKGCGIALLDSPSEVAATVLAYLGRDPNSQSPEDLAKVEETLLGMRPFVRYIHSSQYINDLANGEICVAVGYSGDVLQARDRAAEAAEQNKGTAITVKYSVPKEGTIIWFDMMGIPKDAPHPNNAHAFINYVMKPEVAAAISNYVNYANGNAAATPLVDEGVRNDPGVYPPPEVKAKLFPDLSETQEFTRLLNRTWTRFRTGQ